MPARYEAGHVLESSWIGGAPIDPLGARAGSSPVQRAEGRTGTPRVARQQASPVHRFVEAPWSTYRTGRARCRANARSWQQVRHSRRSRRRRTFGWLYCRRDRFWWPRAPIRRPERERHRHQTRRLGTALWPSLPGRRRRAQVGLAGAGCAPARPWRRSGRPRVERRAWATPARGMVARTPRGAVKRSSDRPHPTVWGAIPRGSMVAGRAKSRLDPQTQAAPPDLRRERTRRPITAHRSKPSPRFAIRRDVGGLTAVWIAHDAIESSATR